MDIVDTQVHFNRIGSDEHGIAAMDAVGIAAVLYDESIAGRSAEGQVLPGQHLPNGAFRPLCPQAEALAMRHPERFGVLRRVDFRDPELEAVAQLMADAPYAKAFRVILYDPSLKTDYFDAFSKGEFTRLFAIANRYRLPVVVLVPGHTHLLRRYLDEFPELNIVIDHSGVPMQRDGGSGPLDAVLELASHKNVSLKWGHAPFFFSSGTYPFPGVIDLLKRAISAFGAERIMWASDYTVTAKHYSWAESLFYLRDSPALSQSEKEWILGATARSIYGWPKTPIAPP